ncbi:MAG: hypothetical protein EHM15_10800 [Desulfobacteraceae bacterium]|nr:MAG: hypothetical protein EHM15_10800 [Desulfobacteraceae bacterium]
MNPPNPLVPGGIYLCQVGGAVSCGACCGLYNRSGATRVELERLLSERTESFAGVPRSADAIDTFRIQRERRELCERPYIDFYACPFLGWIGPDRERPGCLLHPLADGNSGIDYRGLSFYGGLACRDYFCHSYRALPSAHKELVKAVCTDWHLYGLVITEERLITALFAEIETRRGRPLAAEEIRRSRPARTALAELLAVKLDWPFHAPDWKGPANYFFNDGLYPRPPIDYARIGARPSPLDPILHELASAFSSRRELDAAEATIDHLIERARQALGESAE